MNNKILEKIKIILINTIPILIMITLIPFITDDYLLTILYSIIILIAFVIKYEYKDYLFFIFGFLGMILAEYLFVSTGVEMFLRNSFLGLMPLWLPVLWAYAFIVIKRSIIIIYK